MFKGVVFIAIVVCGIWLSAFTAEAVPTITASCSGCIVGSGVISVPLGTEVTFQVSDPAAPIFNAFWSFEAVGLSVKHRFISPGQYTVTVTAVYLDSAPIQTTISVHVVVAPVLGNNKIFGLPAEIVYPILSALATMLLYYLSGYTWAL